MRARNRSRTDRSGTRSWTTSRARAAARRALLGAALALATALPAAHANAAPGGPVLVIRSRAIAPFDAAARAFEERYGGETRSIALGDLPPIEVERRAAAVEPRVVVALGPRAARFARDRFRGVPLVFAMVPEPVRPRIEAPRAVGIATDPPPEAELGAYAPLVPGARRLAVVASPGWCDARFAEVREAAEALGLRLVAVPVEDPAALATRLGALAGQWDALWLPGDPALATEDVFRYLLRVSLDQRRPLFTFAEPLVRAGALATAAPDYAWLGERLVDAVRRLERGERPAAAASGPRPVRLVVNAATARALGLTLDAPALADAELVQ